MITQAEQPKFYVYAHYRKSDDILFYIGKGSTRRASDKSNRNPHWHNVVNKHGYYYKILELFKDETDSLKKEEELISFYRDAGVRLVNILNGGQGNSGARHTVESKLKLRIAHTGKKHTQERKEKQRAIMTGVPKSEAHRAALSKARTGTVCPKTWRNVLCNTNGVIYESLTAAANCLRVDISHVSKCCRGKIKQISGYSFEYVGVL